VPVQKRQPRRQAASDAIGIRFGRPYVGPRVRRVEWVSPRWYRTWKFVAFRHDRKKFVRLMLAQSIRDVEELSGEILMQKQDAQA
jgi:hypothetical protein